MKTKPKTRKSIRKSIIIIIIALLLLAGIIYILGLKVNFVIKEEMDISLSPLEKSFNVRNDEIPVVNFSLEIDNPAICSFSCNYKLIDISSDEVLVDTSFKDKDSFRQSFELPIKSNDRGQKMFNFDVECHNLDSSLCSTNEKKYYKTALVTVNYNLTEYQLSQQEDLKPLLEDAINNLRDTDDSLSQNLELTGQLEYVEGRISDEEKTFLTANQILRNQYEEMLKESKEWRDSWNRYDYDKLEITMDAEKLSAIAQLKQESEALQQKIFTLAHSFNENIGLLLEIEDDESILQEIHDYKSRNNISSDELKQLEEKSESEAYMIITKNFSTFEDIMQNISETYSLFNNTVKTYLDTKEMLEKSLQEKFGEAEYLMQYTREKNISGTGRYCQRLSEGSDEIEEFNQESITSRNELFPFLNNSELLDQAMAEYRIFVVSTMDNGNESFELDPETYASAPTDYPININGTMQNTYDITTIDQEIFDEILVISLNLSEEKSLCDDDVSKTKGYNIDIDVEALNSSRLKLRNISLSEESAFILEIPPPQCCIFGECKPCCSHNDCSAYYPVVFVHGHAISKDNRPENSHEAFNKMQELLEAQRYINAGQIGEGSVVPAGEWGRMPAPISIRVSYYHIAYVDIGKYQLVSQKTEKIENYAIRLKELIQEVKERTGKDKVDIVAHSMGGLVTREYIALFGEDDVNKIILIGTPNHGIEGRIKRLCSITGSSRECRDMYHDSIFLKRLNSPQNRFEEIEGYTITATGCEMKLGEGDGIVLARNVPLNYTTNYEIESECTDIWNSNLHTRILNPDNYPETFELISSILKE